MDYIKEQEDWVKKNNIKVGDVVKINCVSISSEYEKYWKNTWVSGMDKYNNTYGKIRLITVHGIVINGYGYPFMCITPHPTNITELIKLLDTI